MASSSAPQAVEHSPILQFDVTDWAHIEATMATLDVDQKFLARFAKVTTRTHGDLSRVCFQILGLSVVLNKKLARARKLRRTEHVRDSKTIGLYHQIVWLARSGLSLTEGYLFEHQSKNPELSVLTHKLRASFYHIFVLFHNQPSITPNRPRTAPGRRASLSKTEAPPSPIGNYLPPGMAPISIPKPIASFLLPAKDYIPDASRFFNEASVLADRILPGSHPLRLSVKVEYSAYLYDCLHDGQGSRRLAQQSIRDVYNAVELMDDDTYNDSSALVNLLSKIIRRVTGDAVTPSARGTDSQDTTPNSQKERQQRAGEGQEQSPRARKTSQARTQPQLEAQTEAQTSNPSQEPVEMSEPG